MDLGRTDMKLSVRACAGASAALWGGGVLACGLINLASPGYGQSFLKVLQSIYPGFHHSRTASDVLVGAGYAALDGAAAGALFALLYNGLQEERRRLAPTSEPVLEEVAE
jgi:hypothetical protein